MHCLRCFLNGLHVSRNQTCRQHSAPLTACSLPRSLTKTREEKSIPLQTSCLPEQSLACKAVIPDIWICLKVGYTIFWDILMLHHGSSFIWRRAAVPVVRQGSPELALLTPRDPKIPCPSTKSAHFSRGKPRESQVETNA